MEVLCPSSTPCPQRSKLTSSRHFFGHVCQKYIQTTGQYLVCTLCHHSKGRLRGREQLWPLIELLFYLPASSTCVIMSDKHSSLVVIPTCRHQTCLLWILVTLYHQCIFYWYSRLVGLVSQLHLFLSRLTDVEIILMDETTCEPDDSWPSERQLFITVQARHPWNLSTHT